MMKDKHTYQQKDLILNVNSSYDPQKLNLDDWSAYLDVLCGNREYQKEAIKAAIIFLASGLYESTEDLAKENYNKNMHLQQKYPRIEQLFNKFQIRNKLHANIDLATGTGKSYVIYGIAQIMLALGLVKRVLVLCPSLTIEKGLTEKFKLLASDTDLRNAIPKNAVISNPSIIDANRTISEGDICVENIHAVYSGTGSSIDDSFRLGGEDTLVLNDESHHIYNELQGISLRSTEGQNIKKWKEFLISKNYNFKYILGFTGTAYIDNEYFVDVIYRYSLRQAIDDRVVKTISYVAEDQGTNKDYEKFQKIYANHLENKKTYSKIKPLTIMITKDIEAADELYKKLCDFLIEWENLSENFVKDKVLIVTSHSNHAANIPKLDYVDDFNNPIEWIISVSMLTEGWDVKNVFQIVPWEDRAFNSKLLIAQVLGRGLRIPNEYLGVHPTVTISNHANWSKNIKYLVDEVLEIEKRITSSVKYIGERNKYNFTIYNLLYLREEKEVEHPEKDKNMDYSKSWREGINLESQAAHIKREVIYESFSTGYLTQREYQLKYEISSVDEIVGRIMNGFRTREWEGGILGLGDNEIYDKDNLPPQEKIKELIIKSMRKVGIEGENLSNENTQRVLRAFSTLIRKSSKTVIPEIKPDNIIEINTENMPDESLGLSSLRRSGTVFYSDDYSEVAINDEQKDIFGKFINDDENPKRTSHHVNKYTFKTPLNFVFTSESPENLFTKELIKNENAKFISKWIKSRDRGFYQIEYSIRISNHQKNLNFNPDYFILCEYNDTEYIIVVEIKSDKDNSDENKAKYKYALDHFKKLNVKLEEVNINQKYIFHFLSPSNYQTFFEYLSDGRLFNGEFKSELEILLENGQK
ncbi:MAG TPA: DEAD/DEAH box helicase family protein [Bacilli bacterium]|nr:DEAD/DEAH box helicase family protein [Bacilli bacterium]